LPVPSARSGHILLLRIEGMTPSDWRLRNIALVAALTSSTGR
jgi:hypothetical protein